MAEGNRMEKHVTLVGVFHIVYHSIVIVAGFGIFAFLSVIGCLTHDPVVIRTLSTIGAVVGTFLFVLGIPGVIAGIWLLRRRSWARVLAIIVGAVDLLDIPLGTALGVYTFWVLLNDDAIALLE